MTGSKAVGTVATMHGDKRARHFTPAATEELRRTSPRRRMLLGIAVLLMLAGAGVIAFPYAVQTYNGWHDGQLITAFDDRAEELRTEDSVRLDELLSAMRAYNAQLAVDGQAGLRDAWSYQEPSFDPAEWGLDTDGMVGHLSVPSMGCEVPIYLGATERNLARGAAHLSQTSLPIGSYDGVSANTVLAAHRGYWVGPMFTNIEDVQVGDPAYVTNLWGTLEYRVVETRVIDPADIDAVKIQDGRDLLTLITCHPLHQNYQRYVVYCERVA